MSDRFHKAARDGYLDLLKEATRKDCNVADEDGMTPTLWAAYHGNLDALRLIVGRGGDPDRCDHYGNTALHVAAANGHMNCVSFLVNFGVNLWALDNDFHTAKDRAGIIGREELLRFLDAAFAKQSTLNTKLTAKMKEKAVMDAEKRVQAFHKLQTKAVKRAEKDEKKLLKERKKMEAYQPSDDVDVGNNTVRGKYPSSIQQLRKDSTLLYAGSQSQRFSVIVGTTKKKTVSSGVNKLIQKKHKHVGDQTPNGDFKVGEVENGKRSVRSLAGGLRRDSEIMFLPKSDSPDGELVSQRTRLQDVFENEAITLTRGRSESDIGGDESEAPGLFERPGFGKVAFRQQSLSGNLLSIPSIRDGSDEDDGGDNSGRYSVNANSEKGSSRGYEDSIGSAGSLANRNDQSLPPWSPEDLNLDDDEDSADEEVGSVPIHLFLAAQGLQEYVPRFVKERIDLDALMLLTETDLKHMGLPLGHLRKLLKAIEERKTALDDPGEVVDSRL